MSPDIMRWVNAVPKKVMLLLLAVFALAACETPADFDQEEFDRQERQILRQLSGG